MSESAIVVRIRVPAVIERLRGTYDRSARVGVPAHVTILYPFAESAVLGPAIREQIAGIAAEVRAFEVTFSSVARWPGVLYLEPSPSSRFSGLIDRCAAAFPEHPPYGGSIAEVIPHVTVVESHDAPLDELLVEARGALPFETRVEALEVLVEGEDGRWRRRWRLPLSR